MSKLHIYCFERMNFFLACKAW